MALDLARIWNGLYTQLTTASTFATLTGGRVYFGHAPARTTVPYAVVDFVDKVAVDTFESDGYEIRAQVTMYGTKAAGPRAMVDIADAMRDQVQRQRWVVATTEQMAAVVDVERGPTRESELWRYDADVMLTGFAT